MTLEEDDYILITTNVRKTLLIVDQQSGGDRQHAIRLRVIETKLSAEIGFNNDSRRELVTISSIYLIIQILV